MAEHWLVQKTGSIGVDVRTLQHLLTHHGHTVGADGEFGPATQAAVTELLCGFLHSSSYVEAANMRRQARQALVVAGRRGVIA